MVHQTYDSTNQLFYLEIKQVILSIYWLAHKYINSKTNNQINKFQEFYNLLKFAQVK